MLNNRPTGDLWHLQDNDVESQYFEKILHFDFSYIHSEEIKDVVKDYIWQNWKTRSKTLITLQHYIFQFKHFVKFAEQHRLHLRFCSVILYFLQSVNNDFQDFYSGVKMFSIMFTVNSAFFQLFFQSE